MAVMTSAPLDLKAAAYPSADAMALDADTNGVHDVLFDEPVSHPADDAALPTATESEAQPTLNGNHTPSDAPEPITNISSGIDPTAPFIPDSQADINSLFEGSETGTASLTNAIEAPTSDVRDEAGPDTSAQPAELLPDSSEGTQQVLETQMAASEDAMDVSQNVPDVAASQDSNAPSTDAAPTKPMTELTLQTQHDSALPPQLPVEPSLNGDQEMEDAPTSGKVRSREEDDEDDAPDAKRTKTEPEDEAQSEFKVPDLPIHTEQTNGNGIKQTSQAPPSESTPVQAAANAEEWPTIPMTMAQNKFLLERVRNTKKIKVAGAFKDPVNPEVLGIPTYPDLVKNPMDLSTMETKLKDQQYTVVREFMEDLDQIVNNSVLFNGKEHLVTQAGYNMRAYFLKGMGKMPRAGAEDPIKPPKPKKPAVATSAKPRRESRVASVTAKSPTIPTPTATSPQSAWPLNADGLPLIRRDSSSANDRPKREIHRPAPKDLPYNNAKPRKKKYQQELRFCESVLTEIMKPKYQKFAYPFLAAVDPVALNIPSYLKIIKKPMDFGTIEKNLKAGQYQTAKDFHNDALLVFTNCYKFNPEGDEVNKMGKQLHELFDSLWKEKSDWLAQHAPTSDPQSPGSAYSDEEEEEEEEEVDPAQAQILAIQQQIAALNETAQSLLQQQKGKRPSPKVPSKKKSVKAPAPKKKGSLAVPPPPKPAKAKVRVKAQAPLSFTQKQEISDGISTLEDPDMRRAVQIIRNGCPHLANVNDDEMEIDMDEIGDDTLRELFKFLKTVRGPKGAPDGDFEPLRPPKAVSTAKPKKNKPMGKKEQEDSIKRIQDQLRHFEASASGSSQSPPANQDESSDDESSGSESEEE
ncbi:Bromodomain-containing protein [Lophiostoma macrostomum CBS 122681]|uniref:Bromodomain-containing protein n=1 Tax=Lophiostoma macrostomum CBS 122681 TaxID=1314788 RepID=A0A6A6TGR4_9PLEO|nr:Bromodomain-containing protein [Lophiostoma macrostomum CBS 122681]